MKNNITSISDKKFIALRDDCRRHNNLMRIVLLNAVIALLLQSCSSSENKNVEEKTVAPPLETFALSKGELTTALALPGELQAFQQVDIYAKVTGFVKDLKVDIGSNVSEGDVLATLEAPEIASQLAAAESKLKSQEAVYIASKANYNRLLETSKIPGTVSPNDLDIALAKQNSDSAQLDAAKASYREVSSIKDYLIIRAPFNGIVTARNINAGAYVGPGSGLPLFTVQEQNRLRLIVSVPEASTAYLKQGEEINFTVRSLPNTNFTAKITRQAGALDTKLRAERIEMDVTNTNKQLLPGMVAEVNIPLASNSENFIVPKTAVVNADNGIYVIKVVGGKTQRVDVTKSREADDKIEIFGALNAGDTLILRGSEEIRTGTTVNSAKQ